MKKFLNVKKTGDTLQYMNTNKNYMNIKDARAKLFSLKPIFGEIITKWQDKTWLDYYSNTFDGLLSPSIDILNAIEKETSKILGKKLGKDARDSIEEKKWVDTADHHGVLMHPYFYSGALARSHPKTISKSKATVVLAFGNISLSNDSFPRGFFFRDRNFKEEKIYFQSLRHRSRPVFGLTAMPKSQLIKEIERVQYLSLDNTPKKRLNDFLNTILNDDRVWQKELYSEQLTLINQILWKKLFNSTRGDLIYLEIDTVVRNLLLEKHIFGRTNITSLLFNQEWREAFHSLFDNVQGSHQGLALGTELFWYIDEQDEKRKSLFIEGNDLVSLDRKIKIALTPDIIYSHILKRILLPSTALTLIITHLEEKLASAGGFSQVKYLGDIQNAWETLLSRFCIKKNFPNPSIFSGEFCIACLEGKGEKQTASLIDILLYIDTHKKTIGDIINNTLENTSVLKSVHAMVPDLLRLATGEKYEVEDYLNINTIGQVMGE